MFGKKNKKETEDLPITSAPDTVEEREETANAEVALSADIEETESADFSSEVVTTVADEKTENNAEKENGFKELAFLLGMEEEKLIDEFYAIGVKRFLSKLGKVIVRYNINEKQFETVLRNCKALGINETLAAPTYLQPLKRLEKTPECAGAKVCAIVDFPFGESLFKSKKAEVKSSVKMGVNGVCVTLPTMLLERANIKQLKSQVKKYGKLTSNVGIAVSAAELDEEKIKTAVKVVEKYKASYLTLVFGDSSENDIKSKINYLKSNKGSKPVKVLGNVETVDGAMALFSLGVDEVLTPYADDIGKDLVKSFKIKSIQIS